MVLSALEAQKALWLILGLASSWLAPEGEDAERSLGEPCGLTPAILRGLG